MDDLVPGYGAMGRKRATALEEYRMETVACSEVLAELQKTADADLRATMEAVQGRERESIAAVAARAQFHREYLEFLDRLASAHEHLCRRYREINTAVRDGMVPSYFGRDVVRPQCLGDPGLPPPPRPCDQWNRPIERLQHHANLVASLLAEARPRTIEKDSSDPQTNEAEAAVELTLHG
jgi:hypothetical protein